MYVLVARRRFHGALREACGSRSGDRGDGLRISFRLECRYHGLRVLPEATLRFSAPPLLRASVTRVMTPGSSRTRIGDAASAFRDTRRESEMRSRVYSGSDSVAWFSSHTFSRHDLSQVSIRADVPNDVDRGDGVCSFEHGEAVARETDRPVSDRALNPLRRLRRARPRAQRAA